MRPRARTTAAILIAIALSGFSADTILAQHHGGPAHGPVFIGGYFYDPFFGPYPWWGPGAYAYPYFPVYDDSANVRFAVTPKQAAVFIDGYYAGVIDDFDGTFQSLALSPGGHEISIYLDGYQTVHQKLYLTPRQTYKVHYALKPLAAGERSEEPPVAPPVPPPPPGSATLPKTARPELTPLPLASNPATGTTAAGFGTLSLRVQPADAEILIDGGPWTPAQPGERLIVHVPAGQHHIEIRKAEFRPFSTDLAVQAGEMTPLNVILASQ